MGFKTLAEAKRRAIDRKRWKETMNSPILQDGVGKQEKRENCHLNYPQPAPISPCRLVGRATVICSEGRGFSESYQSQVFFLFLRMGPFSF